MARYRGEDIYPPIYLSIYLFIRYRGEDITVHEFAHSLHLLGLTFVFPRFEQELQALYDEAR